MGIETQTLAGGSARLVRSGGRRLHDVSVAEVQELFKSAGALLFRGFEVDQAAMKAFADRFSSRYNRDRLRPPVAGSDGFVQMVTEGMGYIEPHSEQANSPFRPDAIWFCCHRPAERGGETLLWDGVRLWKTLSPDLKHLFVSKKLRFFQCYTPEKWKLFLGTGATLDDARGALDRVDGVTYHVSANGSIYLEYVCSAIVASRFGNGVAFANSLLSERRNTLGDLLCFDDGQTIEDAVIREIETTMESLTEAIAWQPGDLAFIDNSRFLHGRNPFTDTRRQIFSSLSFLNF